MRRRQPNRPLQHHVPVDKVVCPVCQRRRRVNELVKETFQGTAAYGRLVCPTTCWRGPAPKDAPIPIDHRDDMTPRFN